MADEVIVVKEEETKTENSIPAESVGVSLGEIKAICMSLPDQVKYANESNYNQLLEGVNLCLSQLTETLNRLSIVEQWCQSLSSELMTLEVVIVDEMEEMESESEEPESGEVTQVRVENPEMSKEVPPPQQASLKKNGGFLKALLGG